MQNARSVQLKIGFESALDISMVILFPIRYKEDNFIFSTTVLILDNPEL